MADLKAVHAAIGESRYQKSIVSTGKRYTAWCQSRHFVPIFPVRPDHISAFLVARCKELNGSSKSLRTWLSHIKFYSGQLRFPWLDEVDRREVGKVIAHLELFDYVPVHRVEPLVLEVLRDITSCKGVNPFSKMLCAVGHDSLCRAGEICSGLSVAEHIWSADKTEVTLVLRRTKTHRKGGPETITIRDYGSNSGVRHLRRHFHRHNLWRSPQSLVYPSCNIEGHLDWGKLLQTSQFRSLIRQAVAATGRDSSLYSGHSLRAGGATDLFRAGALYPNIKKFGRWKSDTALIYYRDKDAVISAVFEGFRSLFTRMRSQDSKKTK
jgi:hypothetical protein